MRYIILIILAAGAIAACKKKDTYSYTCRCTNTASGLADTVFSLNVPTSGEASYRCKDYADTANAYGDHISCKID